MYPQARFALLLLVVAQTASAESPAAQWVEPLSGIEFVRVAAGCFQMGQAERALPSGSQTWSMIGFSGDLADDQKPRHEVCVDEFWIGQTEVTLQQWRAVGGRSGDGDAAQPAAGLTWIDATDFAQDLSRESPSGRAFDLPTEAEWEYACKRELAASDKSLANAESRRSELGRVAWFAGNRRPGEGPAPVGGRLAGQAGTRDLLGNLWEWVRDDYIADGYAEHDLFNPLVRSNAAREKVLRGGSYLTAFERIGCGVRSMYPSDRAMPQFGFRLVWRNRGER